MSHSHLSARRRRAGRSVWGFEKISRNERFCSIYAKGPRRVKKISDFTCSTHPRIRLPAVRKGFFVLSFRRSSAIVRLPAQEAGLIRQGDRMIGRESEEKIDRVAEMIAEARHIVVFTGAGVSTESGIPDFRSPGGLWTQVRSGGFHHRQIPLESGDPPEAVALPPLRRSAQGRQPQCRP